MNDAPVQIAYKKYRQFRAEHGLELVGYPPDQITESGDLVNPNQFRHINDYKSLHYDVKHGAVHWRELSEVEWKVARDEMRVAPVSAQVKKTRKKANEAAKETAKSVRSKKKKAQISPEMVPEEPTVEEGT